MNFKFKSLCEKIYKSFVLGEYGPPIVPSKDDVTKKFFEVTTLDNIPITKNTKLSSIDIDKISTQFNNIVDDISVLYDAIESESSIILQQLTSSLKEFNGVKRELKQIKNQVDDINAGKIGSSYLEYSFTEKFNSLDNINTFRSDPVDTTTGAFSIRTDTMNLLTLYHYFGKKLEFTVTQVFTEIKDYGFLGDSDPRCILDPNDPRQLTFRVRTSAPSELHVCTTLQLNPDSKPETINKLIIETVANTNKGFIRVYVRKNGQWTDIRGNNYQEIKNDKIVFEFSEEETTHIKIEFIKLGPDFVNSNEYLFSISNLSIGLAESKGKAVLYSKPITMESYSKEPVIFNSIEAVGDVTIPPNCSVSLSVAKDIKINGIFKDYYGNTVSSDSMSIYSFDPNGTGYIFLSDLLNIKDTISGLAPYDGLDFEWKPLSLDTTTNVPRKIEFGKLYEKPIINNSLYCQADRYYFGDPTYTGVYTLYSGWCNPDNPSWTTLASYVTSGIIVRGPDVATILGISYEDIEDEYGYLNSSILADSRYSGQWLGYGSGIGYPFGYEDPVSGLIYFGEDSNSINGWWRPHVDVVTPTGILMNSGITTTINGYDFLDPTMDCRSADFHFNGFDFYRIYKFSDSTDVIDETIKLFSYEERPVDASGYFPHQLSWKYKSSTSDEIASFDNIKGSGYSTFSGYYLPIPLLNIDQDYVLDSVVSITIHGTNTVLDPTEYNILRNPDTNSIIGFDFTPLYHSRPGLLPAYGGVPTAVPYRYWGISTNNRTYTETEIEALDSQDADTTQEKTFTVIPGTDDYIVYAYPTRFGKATFIVNSIEGGFEEPQTLALTDTLDYTEDYYIYRSTNKGLGSTTVSVYPYANISN